jgi:hypothetical protein
MVVFFVGKRLAFGRKATRLRHVERLRTMRVTHIIDVRKYRAKKLDRFKRICLSFKDDARPRPQCFYRRALAFYKKAMSQPGTKHERDRVSQDLLDYCHRDALAMVRLVENFEGLARVAP